MARNAIETILEKVQGKKIDHKAPVSTLMRTDELRRISGRNCRAYIVFRNGKKQQEIWTAPLEHAGLTKQDIKPIRDLLALYAKLADDPTFSKLMDKIKYIPASELLRIDGWPVLIRHYGNNRLQYDIHIAPANSDAHIKPSDFTLPKEFPIQNGFTHLLQPGN